MERKSKSPKRKAVIMYNKKVKRTRTGSFRVPAAQYFPARPEIKALDVTAFNQAITSTANFRLLNGMTTGTALQNHVGRKISLKSLAVRGMVYLSQPGTAPQFDYLRIIIFYDRQPNGAAPAVGDLLLDVDNAGTGTSNAMSSVNLANADRFKILRDWYFKLDSPSTGTGTNPQPATTASDACKEWSFKTFINLKGYETHFNSGTAATVADIQTGSIYVMCLGQNTGANGQSSYQMATRLRYYDA